MSANEPKVTPPVSTPAPAPAPPAPAPKRADDVERYGVAGWRERTRRFEGVSEHAIAGALYDVDDDATLTEAEVKERLEAFLQREGVER